jgi:hypothetical protein
VVWMRSISVSFPFPFSYNISANLSQAPALVCTTALASSS